MPSTMVVREMSCMCGNKDSNVMMEKIVRVRQKDILKPNFNLYLMNAYARKDMTNGKYLFAIMLMNVCSRRDLTYGRYLFVIMLMNVYLRKHMTDGTYLFAIMLMMYTCANI
ncbi:hypothetical protein GMOD_00002630 [Pyrenophora seminiperda CCB06]|uniref:Uncharacterized protein n=1 Tax=Pyrenophora seminiperda CCB06 TaxID=1302712 RepID=A0A3M7M2T6_9PLEO|nr:hypothetical protein GMOD_00002630 [Pyrenophora seminiperda CCB06]